MSTPNERLPRAIDFRTIAADLFVRDDGAVRLVASRRTATGVVDFPALTGDQGAAGDVEQILLSPRGTLFTWTTQEFPPPSPPYAGAPGDFEPYAVGYVEFPEGILVEGRLTVNDPAQLVIGALMETVTIPFDLAGDPVRSVETFGFAPVDPAANEAGEA
ncbi:MAG TPA: OB-fold domain-containing protein [Gordonia sp. (in: high G+C Gram-positive bacteria)]|uniref:Zn-ribbon domain-containing OB-fold protein n=1 Tax=unclassified Gordonia (in: high G+C Gram-positive bacteria) TaxID=2657482 RepID=UPI0025BAEBE5|nr:MULTISPECIES: OB-fold domain-containing protein [unclassified Gordonia (in: high G+C Gram-positive bacteria)]HNP56750.1 OB-fold domain-containing protein [Gordonia sp. (in: high G+C Gram-positive bacteria)]HRC49873.1 OB-fold domain-containing protein [Gordonia sp. (in: high G+C Gram-positive bacteria)]